LVEAPAPVGIAQRVEIAWAHQSGVVDENVEPAELGKRALDHQANRVIALDVERDAEHAAALAAELAASLGVALGILARHDHMRALGQELGRTGPADADARAGDDGDAVLEAEVHCSLLRHARECGHPRFTSPGAKTWMAGTSPAMTRKSARVFED